MNLKTPKAILLTKMTKNYRDEEGLDFSKAFNETGKAAAQASPASVKSSFKFFGNNKRLKYLIAIFVVLIIVQIILIVLYGMKQTKEVPEGYRLVSPPNQPAYIEKN